MSGPEELIAEASRQFTICTACRYCEGYCAVFPAMERRSLFLEGDVSYLANLCHDCRACYQACMYTEPHEFAINIPALLTEARAETYARYSRPRWLAGAFERGPLTLGLLTVVTLAILAALYEAFASLGSLMEVRTGEGAFYDVVSHTTMAAPALLLTAYGLAVAGIGFAAFWRDAGGRARELADAGLWWRAMGEAGRLRWMRGGGGECYYPDQELPSPVRRHMHGLVAYGFLATFAATVSAFVAETVFGSLPPYPVLSVPVLLGLGGGIAVTVGCVGLIALKLRSSRRLGTDAGRRMDMSFMIALLTVSLTGLALLAVRDTAAMGIALLVHLGTVVALYLTAPYGKFMHAVYRFGALLFSVRERRAEAA